MNDKYIELINAIATALSYNGYDKYIIELKDKMEEFNNSKKGKYDTFSMPAFELEYMNDNEQLQLFTMILVLIYGDYGTSPRFGWISTDKIQDCIEFLNIMIKSNESEVN